MPMSTSLKCKCKGRSKKCKNTTLRGGRTAIIGPKIKYKNGSTDITINEILKIDR